MDKILLVDGYSILNRAFYGLPDLTNTKGEHTNGVLGFINIMFKIMEEEKPTHLAVAFDVHEKTFRHKMYEAYKGTRKGMPEELKSQVPLIKNLLQAMQIPVVECPGYEADDIIGTLSKRAEESGMEVSVLSGDRDLLQLATEHVLIKIPKTKGGQTTVENYHT
ncbi:MAG: DNA polymerase I, partial [Lachnospiraceae bacterium]|nr:DNA polymerase I [Lachnospiraceae bacterium]